MGLSAPILTGVKLSLFVVMNLAVILFVSLLVIAAVVALKESQVNPSYCAPRRLGPCLTFLVGFLFGLALSSKWVTPITTDVLLGGYLPISDAQGYFQGAIAFREVGHLTDWATRRPLTSLQLAGLLGLCGGSLRCTVVLLTALGAGGCSLVIAALAQQFGYSAAISAGALLYIFFYPTIGTVMSENIGFTLGCAGFVLMLSAVETDHPWKFGAGLVLTGFGLVARPGAMFVLPVLVVYAGCRFAAGKRFSFGLMAAMAVVIALPFAFNAMTVTLWGQPGSVAFSNFSYTLYGLVHGGENWTRFHYDYPEVATLPAAEQARHAYRAAVAHVRSHPLDLIIGIMHRYNDFFFNTRWFAFDGIGGARIVFMLAALIGLWNLFRTRRKRVSSFLLVATIGVWLSVPFIGDGGTRVHAVTVPFTAALIAAGVSAIVARFSTSPTHFQVSGTLDAGAAGLAVCVLVPLLFVPFYRGSTTETAKIAPFDCAGKNSTSVLYTTPDIYLDIISADGFADGLSGIVTNKALAAGRVWPMPEAAGLLSLEPPFRISSAITRDGRSLYWLVSEAGRMLPPLLAVCIREEKGFQHAVPARQKS